MSLYELTYCSISSDKIENKDILKILSKSNVHNKEKNITGCLLYHNNEFLQILEGNENDVKELYSKIKQDNKHDHVILLEQGEKEERLFKNWNMAFYDLDCKEHEDVHKQLFINNLINFSELSSKTSRGVNLFWRLARQLLMS